MNYFLIKLLVDKSALTKPYHYSKGEEVLAYMDGIGKVRIRECSMIILELEEYEAVVDERDYYRLLLQ